MRTLLSLLIFLLLGQAVLAEPVPVTIWQKEHRFQPAPGETLHLQRGTFNLVMPLKVDHAFSMVAASGPRPPKQDLFAPGHGMAGPYDGLFLTWDGFHYFYLDPTEAEEYERAELWDRTKGLYFWKPVKVYDNTGSPAKEMSWADVPNLTLVFRKKGFEELTFYVDWID